MTDANTFDPDPILNQLREQAQAGNLRLTQHAHQEMAEEEIAVNDVSDAIESAEIVEYYPHHRRGSCCLLHGTTRTNRHLHVVCTTARPVLIIITVYEPKPPKWLTPTERAQRP